MHVPSIHYSTFWHFVFETGAWIAEILKAKQDMNIYNYNPDGVMYNILHFKIFKS